MNILFTPLFAAIFAGAVVLFCGPFFIPQLHKLKFGQSIREEGPQSHQKKTGTPTMGGIIIVLGIIAATAVFTQMNMEVSLALFIMFGYFTIGFIDDYIKVVLKRNLGLKAWQKLLGQVIIAVVVTYIGIHNDLLSTQLWLPFFDVEINLHLFYYILVLLVLVGTTNAVNLTDGLDGLAAGTVAIAAFFYGLICIYFNKMDLAIFCFSCVGALLGFLRFNINPAQIFMGDTGSLALGGVLAAVAILTRTELLLVIVGGIFVIEALSVIIQVLSFRYRHGKRVFLMSPIHHHFELKGWSETAVVKRFWFIEGIFGIIALMILLLE